MAVTTWNTGPAAARYRMSAKRLKKKATSYKRQAELQATSYKRASSERSVKHQALDMGPIIKRQAWRFAMVVDKTEDRG
jgi:hypothetical protein